MKTYRLLLLLLATIIVSCNSNPVSESQEKNESLSKLTSATGSGNTDVIDAYYFHFTQRCVTCKTIEQSAGINLSTLYPEHVRAGLITFKALNLDEDSCKVIADRLGVSGQTLLLVKGDEKINITNEAFMYAVAKPDKFREIINEKVEFLLSK